MFFYFYHSEIFTALYEWLLHFAVYNFCIAFAAGMFRAGALVVLANCAFNHLDTSIARALVFLLAILQIKLIILRPPINQKCSFSICGRFLWIQQAAFFLIP